VKINSQDIIFRRWRFSAGYKAHYLFGIETTDHAGNACPGGDPEKEKM
jgi:hypothetical protein